MRNILTLVFVFTISIVSIACECPEYDLKTLDKESYEWSDVIVIGEVIKTGANYKIIVTELIKGKTESDTLLGTIYESDGVINSCLFFPNQKGKYLFYLNKIKLNGKTYFQYSQCLGTRMLNMETYPISLETKKTKEELIEETKLWIEAMKRKK